MTSFLLRFGDNYWLYVVRNALTPDLQPIQNPAQRLRGDEVMERMRSRVRQAGWQRVAEEGVVWGA